MNATGMASALVTSVAVGFLANAYGYKDIYTGAFLLPLAALIVYFLHVLQLRRRTERRLDQRTAV
jgi:hypothetical protein